MQCAAVTTQSGLINEPPHFGTPGPIHTRNGHESFIIGVPPTQRG
jgi:hypothetical protein